MTFDSVVSCKIYVPLSKGRISMTKFSLLVSWLKTTAPVILKIYTFMISLTLIVRYSFTGLGYITSSFGVSGSAITLTQRVSD